MTALSALRFNRGSTPPGSFIHSARSTAPTGYLLCDGSAVSRTTYAKLFAAIGTTYGAGNGTTTFNLPNTSGLFFRGTGTQSISGKSFTGGTVGDRTADKTDVNGLSASTSSTPSLSLSNTDLTHTHSYNDLTSSFGTTTDGSSPSAGSTIMRSPTNASESDTSGSALTTHGHTITPSITSVVTTISGSGVNKPGSLTTRTFIKV